MRVPLGEAALAAYGYPYGVIYRADLHQVFLDACKALPNVTLRTASKVESFEQDASRCDACSWPAVKSSRAMPSSAPTGCGAASAKPSSAMASRRVSGHIAYRAVLKREDVPAHLWSDDVLLWGGEKTHLVHYPLRRGELFNLVAVFHSNKYDEGWNTFGDTAELNERFAHAVPQVRELLGQDRDLEDVGAVRPRAGEELDRPPRHLAGRRGPSRCCSTWPKAPARRSRMPSCLGEALRFTRGDVAQAFQKYQQARYLRTGRVQLTARFYGDIYHASGVQRELRNQLFQSGKESAGFAGLKWMYDGIDPRTLFS